MAKTKSKTTFAKWLDAQPRGTSSDIARRAGVGAETISKIRYGHKCTLRTAEKISAAIDGQIDVLTIALCK